MNSSLYCSNRVLIIVAMFSICDVYCAQSSLASVPVQPNPAGLSTFFTKAVIASSWKTYVANPFWNLPKNRQIALGVAGLFGTGVACFAAYKGIHWLRNRNVIRINNSSNPERLNLETLDPEKLRDIANNINPSTSTEAALALLCNRQLQDAEVFEICRRLKHNRIQISPIDVINRVDNNTLNHRLSRAVLLLRTLEEQQKLECIRKICEHESSNSRTRILDLLYKEMTTDLNPLLQQLNRSLFSNDQWNALPNEIQRMIPSSSSGASSSSPIQPKTGPIQLASPNDDSARASSSSSSYSQQRSIEDSALTLRQLIDAGDVPQKQKVEQFNAQELTNPQLQELLIKTKYHRNLNDNCDFSAVGYSFVIAAERNEEPLLGRHLVNMLLNSYGPYADVDELLIRLTNDAIDSDAVSYFVCILARSHYPQNGLSDVKRYISKKKLSTTMEDCFEGFYGLYKWELRKGRCPTDLSGNTFDEQISNLVGQSEINEFFGLVKKHPKLTDEHKLALLFPTNEQVDSFADFFDNNLECWQLNHELKDSLSADAGKTLSMLTWLIKNRHQGPIIETYIVSLLNNATLEESGLNRNDLQNPVAVLCSIDIDLAKKRAIFEMLCQHLSPELTRGLLCSLIDCMVTCEAYPSYHHMCESYFNLDDWMNVQNVAVEKGLEPQSTVMHMVNATCSKMLNAAHGHPY